MDHCAFNRQLADAARHVADDFADNLGENRGGSSDIESTLEKVVRLPVDLLENCSLASIVVIRHRHSVGQIDALAASHDDARLVDELQHKLGQGPLVDLRHEDSVISGNVDADNRWPAWGRQVADRYRIRSAMAFRLFTDGRTLAALSLYSEEPDAFTSDDVVDALAVAGQAGITLAAALELDHLHAALRSRRVIGQAVGMVRERFCLTEEQAFSVLKRLSSQQNVKLAHIAGQIVETGDLPSHQHENS